MSELPLAPPPVVILDAPQLADNIGAVARVMANFGLETLRLVRPRDGWPQDRAYAAASGADWVVDGVQVFDTVEAAIADLGRVHAATARPRETVLPVLTPSQSSRILIDDAAQGGPVPMEGGRPSPKGPAVLSGPLRLDDAATFPGFQRLILPSGDSPAASKPPKGGARRSLR